MNIYRNNLKESKSPYLQQHAQNPVHWQWWSEALLKEAQKLDRLLIVSIGYSACHWCHVMEREVFELEAAAEVMNRDFIAIKVDREERPDIDEIYMRALHLMNGQGGWPLNVVCLPDGKPVWGGTYVPLDKWIQVLEQLAEMYQNDRQRMMDYGHHLSEGIQQSMLVPLERSPLKIAAEDLEAQFAKWQRNFDFEQGGSNRAPKFPMPVNLDYLLEFGIVHRNETALEHVQRSLTKMAFGGIYDQIGGGFARYSVDAIWKVPHFEKMLYDNAQLLSVYSKAYRHFKDPLYAEIVENTWRFLNREMHDDSGAWFSALDADSEGEEGKYYVWKAEELQKLIPTADWALFAAYYNVNESGYWEKGNYILLRQDTDEEIGRRFNISQTKFLEKRENWQSLLLDARNQRPKPGLDHKALCSWNALMITAACEAYKALGTEVYLKKAKQTAAWIDDNMKRSDQSLFHAWQEGEAHIEGLLEDYGFCIEAYLQLWQVCGDARYLNQAKKWTESVLNNFEDRESGLFYTRPLAGEQLISKGMETQDNVIPCANSVMAHNLFKLGLILGKSAWLEQAQQNFGHLKKQVLDYGESFGNWSRLGLYIAHPFLEVSVIGELAGPYARDLQSRLHPLELVFYSNEPSELAPFAGRWKSGETQIFPCQQGACQLPFNSIEAYRAQFP